MYQVRPFVPSDAAMLMQHEKNKLMEKINVALKEQSEKIVKGGSVYVHNDDLNEVEKNFVLEIYNGTGEWDVYRDSDRDGSFFIFKPKLK